MALPEGPGAEARARAGEAAQLPVRYCAVYDCLNNYRTHPHLSFFGFPQDRTRVKVWAERIRRPDIVQQNGRVSGYYRVCETHFLPRHINTNRTRRRLMRRAVPTLRLPHAGPYVLPTPLVGPLAAPPTTSLALDAPLAAPPAPRPAPQRLADRTRAARTLVRSALEVCEYVDGSHKRRARKHRRDDKENFLEPPAPAAAPPALAGLYAECDRHLAPSMAEFVKVVARLRQARASFGLDWLCLKLLHSAPAAYRLLRGALDLPSVRALHRLCAPLLPDFDSELTDLLKTRIDRMTEKERHCTLSVEYMDVRAHLYYNITLDRIVGLHEVDGAQSPRPARRAAVVSARGLLARWEQPVALCFLAGPDGSFDGWIDKIIRGLRAAGLAVHALVIDPAAPAAPRSGVTPERPFFFVDGIKIYHLYDPPGLMKTLLCHFMAYDFSFERMTARWSDIQEYRKLERHKALTLTPLLTDARLAPEAARRLRPAAAARLLDRALAAALAVHADHGLLPGSSRATINFILKINNLYDILSSTTMRTSSDFKRGLTQDPGQIGFLTYMQSFFKHLKLENGGALEEAETARFTDRWRLTIAGVLALREELQPVQPHLLTARVHLRDDTPGAGPRRCKPTCRQVFAAYKKRFLAAMLQPPGGGEGKRDEPDVNSLLARAAREVPAALAARPGEGAAEGVAEGAARVPAGEYRRLPAARGLRAAAGQLLQAARRAHGDCVDTRHYADAPPAPDWLQLVARLDEALASTLRQEGAPARGLLRELLLDVHVLDCELPCACFPLDHMKLLFLRLRLYRLLRDNQARFKNDPDLVDFEIDTLQ